MDNRAVPDRVFQKGLFQPSAKARARTRQLPHDFVHVGSHPLRAHGASFTNKLSGTVEVDECYFGPKAYTRGPGIHKAKVAVVALVERKTGQRRSVMLQRVTAKGLHQAVIDHVEAGSMVNTDEHPLYVNLPKQFGHKTVLHRQIRGKKEYHRIEADGEVVTTNYAESSFSLLRRGVIGTFHNLSTKYLPL